MDKAQPKHNLRKKMKAGEVRPYKCTYKDCDWAFKRNYHLQEHLLMHSGIRPYKCQYPGCNKSYLASRYLKRHTLAHEKKNKKLEQKLALQNSPCKSVPVTCSKSSISYLLDTPGESQTESNCQHPQFNFTCTSTEHNPTNHSNLPQSIVFVFQ